MNDLVRRKKEKVFTDSKIIAEKFGKEHRNVTRKIDQLIKEIDDLGAQNGATKFIERRQIYKGQNFRYFLMNRSAFTILAMGFTGKKALRWKLDFEQAFSSMEQHILKTQNQEWVTARNQGKTARLDYTDIIKDFVDYATGQGSRNASKYYMALTKMEYRALRFIKNNKKVEPQFRNTLDVLELNQLFLAEHLAKSALEEGMREEMPYKGIYVLAKNRVVDFGKTMVYNKKQLTGNKK